jgi:NitT/TauT family transport system substrate-binding protein
MKIADRAVRGRRARRPIALAAAGLAALAVAPCFCIAASTSTPNAEATGGPATLTKVTMAADLFSMSNVALYVAIENGYIKQQNIDLDFKTLQSGSTIGVAMQSGRTDIAASASFEMGPLVVNGAQFLAFDSSINVATELCASNSFLASKGITSTTSVQDIARRFGGATIGISGPNSTPDLIARYFFQKVGGLNPAKDLKIVTLGSQPAIVTALQAGQVDGLFASPPTCSNAVATGKATIALRPNQVPAFVVTPQNIMYTTKDYAKAHPDVLRALCIAIEQGIEYTKAHPEEVASKVLKKYLPATATPIVLDELKTVIIPAMPAERGMTEKGWRDVSDIIKPVTGRDLDTKEGGFWTNAYLPKR